MADIIVAADIGTTNVKCVICDTDLRVLGTSTSEYPTYNTGPNCYEHDPEDWWRHFKTALAQSLKNAGRSASEVARVAISSQAPTFLPVDESGEPVYNALIWMDRRAGGACDLIDSLVGNDCVFGITGNIIDPYFVLPKAVWFKREHPELYKKAKTFLQVNGYVNYKLTGVRSIDVSHASLTLMYDTRKNRWSDEILSAVGIDEQLLPKVFGVGDVIGGVTKRASADTGLPEGCLVLAGSTDAAAASVEACMKPDGVSVEMSGTSSVLLVMSDSVKTSKKLVYMRAAHPGWHELLGCMSCAGASLKWFRDTFYMETGDVKTAYERMNKEVAAQCPNPTNLLFLPYMAGERSPIWDSDAKGAIYGMTLGTSRAQIIRAIFEGSAMALYDNYLATVEAGHDIREFRAVGGAANSDIWLKIKASVLGMPIEVPKTNLGAPGGMAAIAIHSMGLSPSIEDAAKALLDVDRVIEPVNEWTGIYREKYDLYKRLYLNNRDINARL